MEIGFITQEYPHPEVNRAAGIATSLKNLAFSLAKKGLGITVFIYGQEENKILREGKIELHLIASKSYRYFTWYFYRKHIQNYINSVVETKKINVLEAPDWTGITAFMKFKVPLVIRFHGSDAYFCKLEKRKQKFKNFVFEKKALMKASAFIAPTAYAGLETKKIFGLEIKKIKTIHYGLQLENFVNNSPHIYNRNSILYIGTIIRKKGVLELAEMFNKVIILNPNTTLTLIGADAPDIKTGNNSTFELMNSVFTEEAKKKVNYLGKIPYSEVKEHIKNTHICTFPSFAETLGMVTIESMALQKPVVNTNIGWAQELIDDGINGYLVHPSEIDLYSKRILSLLNDEIQCLEIGKSARKKVETNFNIEVLADKNIAYYKRIIKQANEL